MYVAGCKLLSQHTQQFPVAAVQEIYAAPKSCMKVAGGCSKENMAKYREKKNLKKKKRVALIVQIKENLSYIMGIKLYGDIFYTPKSLLHCTLLLLVNLF